MTTSEDTNARRDDMIVSDPGGMPVIKGTRVLAYDLAASVKAGIPRDRILAAYPTIKEHHLDLAVAYAEANSLQGGTRGLSSWLGATLVRSGPISREGMMSAIHGCGRRSEGPLVALPESIIECQLTIRTPDVPDEQ